MKKAIIIGASSGIGYELAKLLTQNGFKVGITGRRQSQLEELKSTNPDLFLISVFDSTKMSNSNELDALTEQLGGLDLLIISAGTGELNPKLNFGLEEPTIDLNVKAFTQIVNWTYRFFEKKGSGHITAITSIAGLRGGKDAPAYNASKAYQINYLEAIRQKAKNNKLQIIITDVRPGFVDTAMAKGNGQFWVAPPKKAAFQIYKLIRRRKAIGYVTKRWTFLAWAFKLIPSSIYKRL